MTLRDSQQNTVELLLTGLKSQAHITRRQGVDRGPQGRELKLAVAKAYLDQLSRSQALPASRIADLEKAIQKAELSHAGADDLTKLKQMTESLLQESQTVSNKADSKRLRALAAILQHPSA